MLFNLCLGLKEIPSGFDTVTRNAVKCVAFDSQGNLLMIRTKKGDYKFPGGGMKSSETLQQIYPALSYLDLWRAITCMPSNFPKKANNFCAFSIEGKTRELPYLAEFLIKNYDIMPTKVYVNGNVWNDRNCVYDISKYEPTIEEFYSWKRKDVYNE